MHRTRNAAYGQPYRGFESLPLRHSRLEPPTPGVTGFAPEAAASVRSRSLFRPNPLSVRPALSSEQFPCLGPDPLHNFLCALTPHQRSGLSGLCLHALHAAREFRRGQVPASQVKTKAAATASAAAAANEGIAKLVR